MSSKIFKNWLRNNPVYIASKYSFLKTFIVTMGHKPIQHIIGICVLFVLFLTAAIIFSLYAGSSGLAESNYLLKNESVFFNILTIQATLAALVFPVTLAFVAIYLQNKPSSKSTTLIYVLDSGASVVGISSLMLVLFMIIELLISLIINPAEIEYLIYLNIIWFIYNLALTLYFLYRTFEFINPESQIKSIKSYLINCALPNLVAELSSKENAQVKRSFSEPTFQKNNKVNFYQTLTDLNDEVVDYIKKKDISSFKISYKHLRLLQLDIFKMGNIENSRNLFTELYDTNMCMFGASLLDIVFEFNYSLVDAAIIALPSEPVFFETLCYLAINLSSDKELSFKIRQKGINFSAEIFLSLAKWWEYQPKNESKHFDGRELSELLNEGQKHLFEDALVKFIGGWSTLLRSITLVNHYEKNDSWAFIKDTIELAMLHIRKTALMLLNASNQKNKESFEWLADMMLKWQVIYDVYHMQSVAEENLKFLNPNLDSSLNNVKKSLLPHVKNHTYSDERYKKDLVPMYIKKHWEDICCLMLEIILNKIAHTEYGVNQSIELLVLLINNSQFKEGESTATKIVDFINKDYFLVKIRQYLSLFSPDRNYLGFLNSFIRDANYIYKPKMVSGWIYSSQGIDSIIFHEKQMVVLLLISNKYSLTDIEKQSLIDTINSTQYFDFKSFIRRIEEIINILTNVSTDNHLCEISNLLIEKCNKKIIVQEKISEIKIELSNLIKFLEDNHISENTD